MKFLIFAFLTLLSSVSLSALEAPPVDIRNASDQLEVLPPVGVFGCPTCLEALYQGGAKGASAEDLNLYQEHVNMIWDGTENSGGKANAVDGG